MPTDSFQVPKTLATFKQLSFNTIHLSSPEMQLYYWNMKHLIWETITDFWQCPF